jgi:diguanylate cyclase (GGDEF)-like protein
VRLGLLAKLNLLSIGLIVATAIAIAVFTFWRQAQEETNHLRSHGTTVLTILGELAGEAVARGDRNEILRALDGLADVEDIAYAAMLDARGQLLASRSFAEHRVAPSALLDRRATGTEVVAVEVTVAGRRYLELTGPVPPSGAASASVGAPPPVGHVRIGMSFDRHFDHLRSTLLATLPMLALLVVGAIVVTLILTRRLTAPVRDLTDAAREVAAGRLDVRVPSEGGDEIGVLSATFNRMTEKLGRTQAEVAEYQRTLEQKVTQRTRELEAATARAYKLAQHDILTGLPNRALLSERLKQIVALAHRDGHHVACLFLDFDHFKRINDTLGHDAGDQLLKIVAQRLTQAVRESDTVARLGGDEFVVVLPGLDPAHGEHIVMAILQRIRDTFAHPVTVADQDLALTCSIGVSVYPYDAVDPVSLIKQADTAMYAAKEQGRNTYRFYTADMNARIQARLQMETSMRRGLAEGEFHLVFQPQIEMTTSWPVGVEALLRWNDPNRGLVSPAEFIPVAEESGLIHQLGAWALSHACRRVMEWHRRDVPLRLAVNVSVQQLQHENWLHIVERALAESGLPPRYLDLEITESVIISHPDKAVATLMRLKQMGVTITIDDFGTGYSSLSYLARLPIHSVKIDQRFIRGLEQNRNDESITQAIIALSHSLGLRVIAEGVENPAQFAFLKSHGCEEAQGYYIAKPMPEADLLRWWDEHVETAHMVQSHTSLWTPAPGE